MYFNITALNSSHRKVYQKISRLSIANHQKTKVSDLLLQSMEIDVCCTTAPLTGLPYCLTPPNETPSNVAGDLPEAKSLDTPIILFKKKNYDTPRMLKHVIA